MESAALRLPSYKKNERAISAPPCSEVNLKKSHLTAARRFSQGTIMGGYGHRPRREFLSPLDALDINHENAIIPPPCDALPAR
jgi:hypothetical protein